MWYNKYVGIPYQEKGRTAEGVDCWGLVRLVYKEEFNVELPSYAESYELEDTDRIHELVAQYKEGWVSTDEPTPGTAVLFRVLGTESHIGIYLGNEKFLHSLEGYSSVIDSVQSPSWSKRLIGYFNYSESNRAVLTAIPSPLRTERVTIPVTPGTNISAVVDMVVHNYGNPEIPGRPLIIVNGHVIPEELHETTVVQEGDVIEFRNLPGKSVLRLALIAVIAFYVAPAIINALGVTSPFAKAAISMAVNVVGGLLVNALIPIKPPPMPNDPGSADRQLLIENAQNSATKYQAIPVVLGKVRYTPSLAANTFVNSADQTEDLHLMLCWGFGPLQVEQLQIGGTGIENYSNTAYVTLNTTPAADSLGVVQQFNAIYSTDVEQKTINIKLTNSGGASDGVWVESTVTNNNTTRLAVTYNFPEGLRHIVSGGEGAGNIYSKEVLVELQYQKLDDNNIPIPPGWQDSSLRRISAFSATLSGAAYYIGWSDGETGGVNQYYGYQWTRFGIDTAGNIVKKVGAIVTEPYGNIFAETQGGYYSYSSAVPNSLVRLPAWSADIKPLYDVCMGGIGVYTVVNTMDTVNWQYAGFAHSTSYETDYSAVYDWEAGYQQVLMFKIASGFLSKVGSTASLLSFGTSRYVQRKDPFTHTESINVEPGKYQIRTRLVTQDEGEPDNNTRYMHQCYLLSVAGFANNAPVVEPPNSRLTRTALRIRATDQLNGNIEGISGLVTTICLGYNRATSTWQNVATNNPAALFRYVLQHPASAQRISDADAPLRIDLAALADWSMYCEDNGFTYNNILASQKSLLEVLREISLAGRATPNLVNGKWTVVIDRPKTDIAQHFTPHNSWGFEATKALPKEPDGIKVTIPNEQNAYQEEEVIVYNVGKNALNSEVFEKIDLPGTTNKTQAFLHARWSLAAAKLRPERYTLNTDLEYLVANRGERVKVAHYVTMWGLHTGHIKNKLGPTNFELDEAVYLETTKQYDLRVRSDSGTSYVYRLSSVATNDWYTTVQTNLAAPDSEINVNNLFMIGEASLESVDLLIHSIEPQEGSNARITLMDYAPELFSINYLNNFAVPSFNTQVTVPPPGLKYSVFVAPVIDSTTIVSDETVLEYVSKGVFKVRMQVPLLKPADLPEHIEAVQVEIKSPSDDGLLGWASSVIVPRSDPHVLFSDMREGDVYDIRARYVGKDGRTGPWSSVVQHTVTGKLNPPANVANLSITANKSSGLLSIKWDSNPEMDVMGYEVRTADSGWNSIGYTFQGDATSINVPGTITATYYVKAYDTGNRYSNIATQQTFTVVKPSAPTSVSALFSESDVLVSWPTATPGSFDISSYRIVINKTGIGTQEYTTASNRITVPAEKDWVGAASINIYSVDILGNESISSATTSITKAIPSNVSTPTTSVEGTLLTIKWPANSVSSSQMVVYSYEVRTDQNFGTGGAVAQGDILQAVIELPKSTLGTQTWYIRARDISGQYSTASVTATHTITAPAAPIAAPSSYSFAATTLTSSTVTVMWLAPTSTGYGIKAYKVTYNGSTETVNATYINTPATWLGDRTYSIKTIDMLDNESTSFDVVVNKQAPASINESTFTGKVIDNNVLLYWDIPAVTSLPISHVEIRKGTTSSTWETASVVGTKDGTFTSLYELSSGVYRYWIKAVDTDNRYSATASFTDLQVSQPPDFIFHGETYFTMQGASKSNAMYGTQDQNSLVMPVSTTETFEQHFTTRSWTTIDSQIVAGYPYYAQPGVSTGYYEEVWNLTTPINSSQITVTYSGNNVAGAPSVVCTISYSLDGTTYTTPEANTSIFGTNFQYVKVRITVNQNATGDIYHLTAVNVRLDAKIKTDAGNIFALSTDTNGTIVNFSSDKEFVDVTSITLTSSGTTAISAAYDFSDSIKTFTYTVTSNVLTANFTPNHGNMVVGQKVRLYFNTGTAPNGTYLVGTVTDADTLTFNITTPNTSGAGTMYPNSFRAYLFNSTTGARVSAQLSWSVRGY